MIKVPASLRWLREDHKPQVTEDKFDVINSWTWRITTTRSSCNAESTRQAWGGGGHVYLSNWFTRGQRPTQEMKLLVKLFHLMSWAGDLQHKWSCFVSNRRIRVFSWLTLKMFKGAELLSDKDILLVQNNFWTHAQQPVQFRCLQYQWILQLVHFFSTTSQVQLMG